ncbi:MAG: nprA [Bacteroidetes bacterium]|nr:nprA [Bacteroidota bacterium]
MLPAFKHILLLTGILFFFAVEAKAQNPKDTIEVNRLLEKAKTEAKNDTAKAFVTVKAAIALAQKSRFKNGLIVAYNTQGRLFRQTGNYDRAIASYKKGLSLCDSVKNWYNISGLYNNLGTVYLKKGNNKLALDYFVRSLKASEGKVDPIENAPTENNIGLIYWDLGQHQQALEYFQATLETFKKAGDNVSAAGTYSNIGGVYYYMKDYKKSLGYFKLSLQAYENAGDSSGVGLACTNIADLCSELKHYDEAEVYLKRAFVQLEQTGDVPNMVYALLGMANAASGKGQHKKSEEYLKKAMGYSEKMNSLNNQQTIYLKLAETYANMNSFKDAYFNLGKYASLKDTIHNQDAAKQVAELNAKYKDEQKNKTIELLKKEKEIADLNKQEEKRSHAAMRNYLIASIIAVFLIAAIVFVRFRTKQKANKLLEKKNRDIEQQKEQIENKNSELAEKNKEITDGIQYAKRIQMALLPQDKYFARQVKDHFILYKPKDIVSGDFYWGLRQNEYFYFAVADCTGHGVPGAFMSMIGINLLNEIIVQRKCSNPALILDIMREEIMRNLNGEDAEEETNDGMDMVLCRIHIENKQMDFAAANNALYVFRKEDQSFTEYKGDKMPVGKHVDTVDSFTKHSLQLKEGDTIYAFTDGFPDQFGGPKGKKFKYKQLEEALANNLHLPLEQQSNILNQKFEAWKGELEQVDDVCIIGIKL